MHTDAMDADAAVAAREDERDAVEGIYGEDFVLISETEWSLRLAEVCASLRVTFPPGYPQDAAPHFVLEADEPLSRAAAAAVKKELVACWEPGEVCVFQCAELAKEALERQKDVAGGGAESDPTVGTGGGDGGGEIGRDDGAGETGQCSVPIDGETAQALDAPLISAGFAACGPGLYVHSGRGVTIEVGEALVITVDGIDTEDLADYVRLQLEDVGMFGKQLLEWTTAQRAAEPGFLEEEEAGAREDSLEFLPSPEELKVTQERPLLIYTWGKALRKGPPPDSQFNFNAGVLNGRGGGADLRTMNGLSEQVQKNVASCGLFPRWLQMVTSKIETAGLDKVSVNCTKGRHRSVAAAEIMKSVYYPNATVKHLTIY